MSARQDLPIDVYEAAYRVAHDYGVQKLAARAGIPAGTLYNKLNPGESTHHKLTLADVIQISVITHDNRILHSLAHTLGEVCFAVPDLAHVSDAALLELIAKVGAKGGDFHRALGDALEDGAFSLAEHAKIRKEALEWIAAIWEAVSRMEGLIDG